MEIGKVTEWISVTVWWRYFLGFGICKLLNLLEVDGGVAGIWTPDTADMSLNPENRQDGNIIK